METATAAAMLTGRGKRRQEETLPDDAVLNEKRAKKPILKVTAEPPSSAKRWNKSLFLSVCT
jgi:hypothetical protein